MIGTYQEQYIVMGFLETASLLGYKNIKQGVIDLAIFSPLNHSVPSKDFGPRSWSGHESR